MVVHNTGNNHWEAGPNKTNQTYLVLTNATAASEALDELLCHPPKTTNNNSNSSNNKGKAIVVVHE